MAIESKPKASNFLYSACRQHTNCSSSKHQRLCIQVALPARALRTRELNDCTITQPPPSTLDKAEALYNRAALFTRASPALHCRVARFWQLCSLCLFIAGGLWWTSCHCNSPGVYNYKIVECQGGIFQGHTASDKGVVSPRLRLELGVAARGMRHSSHGMKPSAMWQQQSAGCKTATHKCCKWHVFNTRVFAVQLYLLLQLAESSLS